MACAKVKGILKSKNAPFTEEQMEAMTDGSGWGWIMAHKKPDPNAKPEIHFTGFEDAEKAVLTTRACSKFKVVKSVTANIQFLICGENAGPKKIKVAEALGATLVQRDDFEHLMSTGEIKE